jgi:Ca-activated chloride channel family protein
MTRLLGLLAAFILAGVIACANLKSREHPSATELASIEVVNGKAIPAMYFEHYGVNPTIDTEEAPVSNFSIDVDTASYTLARSYLDRNALPEEAAVRVEEFINAQKYNYPPPGEAVFGVHAEVYPSPHRQGYHVLHLGLRGKDVTAAQREPATLVFTIDVSSSMSRGDRLDLVKQALTLLLGSLDGRDQVGIVVYGSKARVVLPLTPATEQQRIRSAIDALSPEGATNVQAGLELAYGMLAAASGRGRIILCSDGVANQGITEAQALLAQARGGAGKGVALTTVGFGMGNYNDVLMEKLAQSGDGQYAYVDSLQEAKRIFVEEASGTLQLIARDVKVQLHFDKDQVSRYRLIGFENRRLANRDFADDAVDSGDLGAGQSVTALYEVKFRSAPSATSSFAALRIRYKPPEGNTSQLFEAPLTGELLRADLASASPAAKLALVASVFGEKLRGSYWVRNVSWVQLEAHWEALPVALRSREEVGELKRLLSLAAQLDRRKAKFGKDEAGFDDVPIVR